MARITDFKEIDDQTAPRPRNGKTVLIAEDDPFIARMYQTKLETAGYTVVVKNNGRDAYDHARQNPPDLFLLDLTMPELSGLDVLKALQGDHFDFGRSPVIVLTNSSSQKDRAAAEAYGAEYLTKADLTPRAVLERINIKLGLSNG
jgi:DNA-binding response OmpR family regulator